MAQIEEAFIRHEPAEAGCIFFQQVAATYHFVQRTFDPGLRYQRTVANLKGEGATNFTH